MTELPALTPRKVIKVLEKAGFIFKRQKGSHRLYVKIFKIQKGSYGLYGKKFVTVPYHNKDLKKTTLKSIIEQSGLSKEEFLNLLKK